MHVPKLENRQLKENEQLLEIRRVLNTLHISFASNLFTPWLQQELFREIQTCQIVPPELSKLASHVSP